MKELVQVNVNLPADLVNMKPKMYLLDAEDALDTAYQGFIKLFNGNDKNTINGMNQYLDEFVTAHSVRGNESRDGRENVKRWFLDEYDQNSQVDPGTKYDPVKKTGIYEVLISDDLQRGIVQTLPGQYHQWTDDVTKKNGKPEKLRLHFKWIFSSNKWVAVELDTRP